MKTEVRHWIAARFARFFETHDASGLSTWDLLKAIEFFSYTHNGVRFLGLVPGSSGNPDCDDAGIDEITGECGLVYIARFAKEA